MCISLSALLESELRNHQSENTRKFQYNFEQICGSKSRTRRHPLAASRRRFGDEISRNASGILGAGHSVFPVYFDLDQILRNVQNRGGGSGEFMF